MGMNEIKWIPCAFVVWANEGKAMRDIICIIDTYRKNWWLSLSSDTVILPETARVYILQEKSLYERRIAYEHFRPELSLGCLLNLLLLKNKLF